MMGQRSPVHGIMIVCMFKFMVSTVQCSRKRVNEQWKHGSIFAVTCCNVVADFSRLNTFSKLLSAQKVVEPYSICVCLDGPLLADCMLLPCCIETIHGLPYLLIECRNSSESS